MRHSPIRYQSQQSAIMSLPEALLFQPALYQTTEFILPYKSLPVKVGDLRGQEVPQTFRNVLSSFCLFLQALSSSWEELTGIFLELLY